MSEQEIFEAALERDAELRAQYLDEVCGTDSEMRQRIEDLLKSYEGAGDFFEKPAAEIVATIVLPISEQPGDTIGPYKLLQQIGEGGMGVVYLAEQAEPIERRVALKIIKPGMDTRKVIARFEAERQALAMMDHPNIAKVLDAGVTETGRPYFVMELVKGVSVTQYCDEKQLTLRQRLELFVPICQAIQHAHQKGIIHRDIKPSNVLVAEHDERAVPKVIDFGVAKAIEQHLTEKTVFTEFGQVVGTPEYMSPEQAKLNQLDIDTRTDVYSLGVLLYELLVGETPFDRERLRSAAFDELLQIIREEEPPRPSLRLSSSASLPSIASNRHTEPKKLSTLVHGELDWIVMKALEKDRTRRYDTASKFAEDVEHYLNDEAVAACPPSATYRLWKITRKYRVPLFVAAGFLMLLVVVAAVSTYQAIRIRSEQQKTLAQKMEADRQRNRAEQERDRAFAAEQKALTEVRKSEQVAAFMADMLEGVGPSVALGRDDTMLREILANTTKRLDELRDQPAVETELRLVLGDIYYDLGDFESSETMFRAALALQRKLFGNKHPDVACTLSELGEALRKQSRFDETEPLFAEALAMQRELLGDFDPAVGLTLYRSGMMFNVMGRGAEAEERLRAALSIYRQMPSQNLQDGGRSDRKSIVAVLDQLGLSLMYQGKYPEGEQFTRECLAMAMAEAPVGSPQVGYALHNLGFCLREQGKLEEAEQYLREALEMRLKLLGDSHVDVQTTRIIFAESLRRQRKYDEAEACLRDALAIAEISLPDDWRTHSSRLVLAKVLMAQERYAEAEPLLLSTFKNVRRRKEAAQALLDLYEATGQTEKLLRLRETMDNLEQSQSPPDPQLQEK